MERTGDDAEGRRRRRWGGLFALSASALVHLAIFFSLVMPPPEAPPDRGAAMAEMLIDIAVPGLGPPGAPAGDAPSIDEADDLAEALDAPAVPLPRARRTNARADAEAVPTELAEEGTPADVAETTSEAGAPDGDQLIDALIARSRGAGAGAGGNGGAGCPDPIAGTWHTRKYRSAEGWWSSFTLHISREGGTLTGRVRQHAWTGGPDDRTPPICTPGIFEHRVDMGGEGWIRGDQVRFDALGPPRRTVVCMGDDLGYNLDHFTGTLRGNRILAVNNDGGRDVNAPYTFRRTSCD